MDGGGCVGRNDGVRGGSDTRNPKPPSNMDPESPRPISLLDLPVELLRQIAESLDLLDIFRLRFASRAALEIFTPLLVEAIGRVLKVDKKPKVVLLFIMLLKREGAELSVLQVGRLLRRVGVAPDSITVPIIADRLGGRSQNEASSYGLILRGLRAPPKDVAVLYDVFGDKVENRTFLNRLQQLSQLKMFLECVRKAEEGDAEGIPHDAAIRIALDYNFTSGWHVIISLEDWQGEVAKRSIERPGTAVPLIQAEVYGSGVDRIWESARHRFGKTDRTFDRTADVLFEASNLPELAMPGIAGCSLSPAMCGKVLGYAFGTPLVINEVEEAWRFWKSLRSFFSEKSASDVLREKGFSTMCERWRQLDPLGFDAFCLAPAASPDKLHDLFGTLWEFFEISGFVDPSLSQDRQALSLLLALAQCNPTLLNFLIDESPFELGTWNEAAIDLLVGSDLPAHDSIAKAVFAIVEQERK